MRCTNQVLVGLIVTVLQLQVSLFAGEQKAPPKEKKPAGTRLILRGPEDNPDLPNVLIIGDSISLGYTRAVSKSLAEKCDVFRPNANCGPSRSGVRNIKKWIGDKKWDVIHFNFGIWDTHYMYGKKMIGGRDLSKYKLEDLKRRSSPEKYVQNLKEIIDAIKPTGATLIWASTTPLMPKRETTKIFNEATKRVVVTNNKVAAILMKKEGVIINDLHTLALPHLKEWQQKDGCHFTKEGYRKLAEQVASSISNTLSKKSGDSKPKGEK